MWSNVSIISMGNSPSSMADREKELIPVAYTRSGV
ncbi:Uncharacterised protein [Mycobacterium tuberculosis]|nr:Uncharacterised protein [Mycobacterium tuberculosis]